MWCISSLRPFTTVNEVNIKSKKNDRSMNAWPCVYARFLYCAFCTWLVKCSCVLCGEISLSFIFLAAAVPGEELLSFTIVVGMVVYWRQEATGITFAPSVITQDESSRLLLRSFYAFCLWSNQVEEVLNIWFLDILHYFGTNGHYLNCSQLHASNKVWPVRKYTALGYQGKTLTDV